MAASVGGTQAADRTRKVEGAPGAGQAGPHEGARVYFRPIFLAVAFVAP